MTGATGFTGGHTLKALRAHGHEPRALVRSPAKLEQVEALHGLDPVDHVVGDVTDPAAVAALLEGCDAVIHVAAVAATGRDATKLIEATNVPSTRLVLEHAAGAGLDPIVHVSSQSALHPPPGGIYRAGGPLSDEPIGAYGISKVESERIARRLQDEGHPVVIVWPSGITGPDDVGISVGAAGSARLLNGSALPLPKSGGLLLHDVRDLADVLARTIEAGRGARGYGVFGHYLPWADVPAMIEAITGRTLAVRRLPDGFFHALGRVGDVLGRIGVPFPLDGATATFMTSLVPGDDEETRRDLGIEWRPVEETYGDMLRWLVATDHLAADKAPALR